MVLEDPQRRGASERGYSCDMVLGEQSSQQQVYAATVAPLVRDVLRGFHAAVFAYGATGSGKTHTMVGRPQSPGVMVRALDDLFQGVAGDPGYSVKLLYTYNSHALQSKLRFVRITTTSNRKIIFGVAKSLIPQP